MVNMNFEFVYQIYVTSFWTVTVPKQMSKVIGEKNAHMCSIVLLWPEPWYLIKICIMIGLLNDKRDIWSWEKNNQCWLSSNILKVTRTNWKLYYSLHLYLKFIQPWHLTMSAALGQRWLSNSIVLKRMYTYGMHMAC